MNNIIFAGKHFLTYNVSRHQHDTWELIYCTGETGKFVFADLELPYSEGDVVVILEAMKMENEILAPCDGTVAQIVAGKGASVNSGDALVVIG